MTANSSSNIATELSTTLTDTPIVYQSLISARSRRLRATGAVLLVAVLGMTLYGSLALMPSLRTLPHLAKTTGTQANSTTPIIAGAERTGSIVRTNANKAVTTDPDTPRAGQTLRAAPILTERERKAALAKVLFVYGYWSVCGLLILALVIVSWLDFRELGRAYDAQRARLVAQSLADAQN